MAVRIRLARAGAKKKPFYRVVVADKRMPRDGRFIEIVGRYNPRATPTLVELDLDRIKVWLDKGASPSETVEKLIAIAESPDAAAPVTAKDKRVSKKSTAADEAAAAEAEKAAAEPAEEEAPAEEAAAEEAPAEEAAAEEAPAEEPAEEAAAEEVADEAAEEAADEETE